MPCKALALPEGLVVQGGVIGVSQPDASTLLIQQGTDRAAGDWRSFNIGAAERVTIQQPNASSLMLARVTSGVGTEIFGQLNANGGLLLLNPHGVLIGPGASINTASFAAGTLNADPSRFMQGGPVQLERLPGAPLDAAVINRGNISVADAGLVALISPQVINQGLITARLGTIHLATGTTATLDLNGGTGLYQVALDPALSASLLNQGQIEGQFVRIGAGEAQALLHSAVNLDGLVVARGADGGGGTIEVRTSGDLQVNGRLDANGDAGARGGTIKLLADRVALLDQARVEASGGTGGGEILIGGNYLGQGPEPNARVAVLTPGAEVKADATQQGNGGRVILWSDVYTGFYGKISARGGVTGGNGGFVETSSKDNLQAWGSVDASALQGQSGLWLLDPANISIASSTSGSWSTQGPIWETASATTTASINVSTLLSQLAAGTNITITTANTSGTSDGNITVVTNMTANPENTATLTLTANKDIDFRGTNLSLPKVDLVITAARNVRYGTTSGSTFRSVTQQAGSGTATVYSALNTSGGGGISLTSNDISVPASITAAQGNISLVSSTGAISFPGTALTTVQATAGNVTINSASSISIDSQSSFAPVSFIAGAGSINFSATTGTTLNGLAFFQAAGAPGNVTLSGDINAPASVVSTDEVDSIQVDATGAVVFNGAIGQTDRLGSIQIDNSQTTTFNNAISLAPLVYPSIATGAIVVNGTVDKVLFNANVSASRIVAAAGNYEISFAGSSSQFDGFIWDGTNNVASSAIVDFGNTGKVTLGNGSGNVLTFGGGGLGFSGNAAVVLNGTVRSTADPTTNANAIDFGTGGVTVAGPSVVDTTNNGARDEGGNIAFGGAVTGNLQALTIRASTGLGTLDATGVNFAGNVVLNTLTVDPGNYKVSFSGASNVFGTALDFQNSGLVTMGVAGNATNEFTFDNGLAFSGNSVIQLGGIFITPGQAFNLGAGNPTLIANTTVDTTNYNNSPTGGNIAFGGVLGGAYSLTVNAGTGGAITETNIDGLTSLRVVDALMMRVNGYATLDSLTIDKTASGAANGVIIAGNATINEFVTGNNQFDLTLNGTSNVFGSSQADTQRVQFKNTGNLSLGDDLNDTFLFDDGFEFTGNIGTDGPSRLLLGATIRTTGEAIITSGRTITLVSDSIIDATGGGGIWIDAAVNATKAGLQALTLDTSGAAAGVHTIEVSGAIGDTTPLGALTISSADTLTLGANATIATKKLTGNPASTGAISLTATNGITTSAAGATATAPTLASDGGPISINSAFTLNADQVVTSAGGAISFAGAVNGSNTRTLSIDGGSGGSASFAGDVNLKAFTTLANTYSVSFTGSSNTFTDALTFANTGALTLGNGGDVFTFTGGVVATAPSGINLGGTVSAAGTGVISLGDNDTSLNVTGTSSIGGASTGTITLGATTLADGATLTVGAGAATPINLAAVSGTAAGTASNLMLNTTAAVNVSGAIGTDIGTLTITSSGGTTFAGNVAVNSFVTTANSSDITFKGVSNSFTQAVDFLTTGTVSLGDAAGGGDEFLFDGGLAFSGNAAINLKGKILSSGDAITFGTGAIALLSISSIDATKNAATGADIKIGGAISDGASSNTLTLNAGSAGDITASGSISISKLEVVNAALNTATFEGNVTVDDFITNPNNYSVAFTGSVNSFANAVTFLNTGALTLGNGADTFTFTAGVTATAPTVINLSGTVSAAGTSLISMGKLNVTGTSTIGGTSTGTITLGNATLANNATLTVGAGAATPITLAAVSGTAGVGNSSDLTFNTTAPVNVTGAVSTNIGTVTITNSGGATFAGNVQIGRLVTTNNAYAVSLTGSSNSFSQSVDFLNTGLVTLGDAAGTDLFVFDGGLAFTGNAASTIGGVIRSSADAITFGSGGITLLATSAVDSTNNGANAAGAAITFGSTVNGTVGGAAEALTVAAGLGNVTFSGAVGGIDPLGAITINTGGQTLFDSTVNALSLYTDQPGTAILNGNITTTGAAGVQINEWTIDIQSGLTIDTTSGNGTVVLGGVGGAINSVGAAKDLTISSGTANVTVNSSIGATNALGALAINTSGATTFNSSVTATSVITDTPGTAILNGNITASGAAGVQIQELTIGLYSPVTIISTAGPVSLGGAGGTINSETGENNNLTITAGNANDVTLKSSVGGTQRLGNIIINTSGLTSFNAAVTAMSISTDQPGSAELYGSIDVNGSVGLLIRELAIGILNPIAIVSSNGPVILGGDGGRIDSSPTATNGLTITAGTLNNPMDVTFNADIGPRERLGDIVVNTSGATLFNGAVTATSISTDQPGTAALNGNLDVNGAGGVVIRELTIALNDHITINSTIGPVTLSSAGGAINSQTGETNDLIITAGSKQEVRLNATLGGTQALRDVKVYTEGITTLKASITAASLYTDGPGRASLGNSTAPMLISLSGAGGAQINELLSVILDGPVTINTTNAPVLFAGPLDSQDGTSYNFTANAGTGAITFNGPVGGTTKPYNLILTGGDININATTQAMNVTMTGGNLNWNADIISPGFGTPGVPYGYHTFVGTINLLRNVTIEGNIGLINGTREYTTPRQVGGFTLTPRYNGDPVIVVPAEDPPNLLNNQLNMNQIAASVPADLAPPSGPTPPSPRAKELRPENRQIAKAAADGRVCLLTGDGLCVAPSREQTAGQPSTDPAKQTSATTPAPATSGAAPLTAPLPAPLPPVSQAQ